MEVFGIGFFTLIPSFNGCYMMHLDFFVKVIRTKWFIGEEEVNIFVLNS